MNENVIEPSYPEWANTPEKRRRNVIAQQARNAEIARIRRNRAIWRAIFATIGAMTCVAITATFTVLLLSILTRPAGPPACSAPGAPAGTTVSVHADGSATAPYTGGPGLVCSQGVWIPYNPGPESAIH